MRLFHDSYSYLLLFRWVLHCKLPKFKQHRDFFLLVKCKVVVNLSYNRSLLRVVSQEVLPADFETQIPNYGETLLDYFIPIDQAG